MLCSLFMCAFIAVLLLKWNFHPWQFSALSSHLKHHNSSCSCFLFSSSLCPSSWGITCFLLWSINSFSDLLVWWHSSQVSNTSWISTMWFFKISLSWNICSLWSHLIILFQDLGRLCTSCSSACFSMTFFSKKLFSSLLMSPQSAWVLLLFSQESLKKFSLYWYPSWRKIKMVEIGRSWISCHD